MRHKFDICLCRQVPLEIIRLVTNSALPADKAVGANKDSGLNYSASYKKVHSSAVYTVLCKGADTAVAESS